MAGTVVLSNGDISKTYLISSHFTSGVVGIIDGSLIRIQKPRKKDLNGLHPDLFFGRKGYSCLNILAIVDAKMKITYMNSL